MSRNRSNSEERNAPRCVIGKELRVRKLKEPTPGPNNYINISQRSIGGQGSIRVPFPTAIRPISARPEEIKSHNVVPGPQDYQTICTDKYKERKYVIPHFAFQTALRENDGPSNRSKSPGPNHYRPNSAVVQGRHPNCTIGNSKRSIVDPPSKVEEERKKSPAPNNYEISRDISNGPKYYIGKKYESKVPQAG